MNVMIGNYDPPMGYVLKAVGVAVLAAVAFAAPAGATPEQDYLDTLAGVPGVTVNPFTSILLTNAGNASCADLRAGVPLEEVAVRQLSFPGSTLALTRIMVATAQQTLCPDAV